jgi:hypothetical protein
MRYLSYSSLRQWLEFYCKLLAISFMKTAEGYWLLKEYRAVEQTFTFSSVKFEIPLEEIYEGVQIKNN